MGWNSDGGGRKAADIIAEQYARIFADRFRSIDPNAWDKPWISGNHCPAQNISGNIYKGGNQFYLSMLTGMRGYNHPLFLTDRQCRSLGVHIRRDEHAFPIVFCRIRWNDVSKSGRASLSDDEYNALPMDEREGYVQKVSLFYHNGFNIDQTDFAQVMPEKMEEIERRYSEIASVTRDVHLPEVDVMLRDQGWICPVTAAGSDSAYYSQKEDRIVVPAIEQFPDRGAFYGTLFHEMTHSTGPEGRLGRDMTGFFGTESYAREELVAELSSAILCNLTGLDATIREDNLQYLKNWNDVIGKEPDILRSVLRDASMAADFIGSHVKLSPRPSIDLGDMADELKARNAESQKNDRHEENKKSIRR